MAISRVRQNSSTPASATTMTVTLTSVTAGDLLVVCFLANNNVSVTSVADDHSNTFSAAVGMTFVSSVGAIAIYYKENCSASSGTDTITITLSAASGGGEVAIAEYSGAATSSSLDQNPATATGTSATQTSASFNPSQSTELAILWTGMSGTGGNPTAGTNYTNVVQPDAFTCMAERISPPTGSQTGTTTTSSSLTYGIDVATFLAAAGITAGEMMAARQFVDMPVQHKIEIVSY